MIFIVLLISPRFDDGTLVALGPYKVRKRSNVSYLVKLGYDIVGRYLDCLLTEGNDYPATARCCVDPISSRNSVIQ